MEISNVRTGGTPPTPAAFAERNSSFTHQTAVSGSSFTVHQGTAGGRSVSALQSLFDRALDKAVVICGRKSLGDIKGTESLGAIAARLGLIELLKGNKTPDMDLILKHAVMEDQRLVFYHQQQDQTSHADVALLYPELASLDPISGKLQQLDNGFESAIELLASKISGKTMIVGGCLKVGTQYCAISIEKKQDGAVELHFLDFNGHPSMRDKAYHLCYKGEKAFQRLADFLALRFESKEVEFHLDPVVLDLQGKSQIPPLGKEEWAAILFEQWLELPEDGKRERFLSKKILPFLQTNCDQAFKKFASRLARPTGTELASSFMKLSSDKRLALIQEYLVQVLRRDVYEKALEKMQSRLEGLNNGENLDIKELEQLDKEYHPLKKAEACFDEEQIARWEPLCRNVNYFLKCFIERAQLPLVVLESKQKWNGSEYKLLSELRTKISQLKSYSERQYFDQENGRLFNALQLDALNDRLLQNLEEMIPEDASKMNESATIRAWLEMRKSAFTPDQRQRWEKISHPANKVLEGSSVNLSKPAPAPLSEKKQTALQMLNDWTQSQNGGNRISGLGAFLHFVQDNLPNSDFELKSRLYAIKNSFPENVEAMAAQIIDLPYQTRENLLTFYSLEVLQAATDD